MIVIAQHSFTESSSVTYNAVVGGAWNTSTASQLSMPSDHNIKFYLMCDSTLCEDTFAKHLESQLIV